MDVETERLSLGTVEKINDQVNIVPNFEGFSLSLEEYSRFKYGDGATARYLGMMMAHQFMDAHADVVVDKGLYVTSSAYKVARPASGSLVAPFIWTVKNIAEANGEKANITPFKINRTNLTEGDYAKMSIEERTAVMLRNGLQIPDDIDLEGAHTVALDDIYVTGSHEKSIDKVLTKAGISWIGYLYILHATGGKLNPTLESELNGSAVQNSRDIIELMSSPQAQPNARLGKFLLSQSADEIIRFNLEAPRHIKEQIFKQIEGDELGQMPGYSDAYEKFEYSRSFDEVIRAAMGLKVGFKHFRRHESERVPVPEKYQGERPRVSDFKLPRAYVHAFRKRRIPRELLSFREEISLSILERSDIEPSSELIDRAIDLALEDGWIKKDKKGYWSVTRKSRRFLHVRALIEENC